MGSVFFGVVLNQCQICEARESPWFGTVVLCMVHSIRLDW